MLCFYEMVKMVIVTLLVQTAVDIILDVLSRNNRFVIHEFSTAKTKLCR